jgi:DNA-binding LytR/AlgR family response regulator
VFLDVELPGLTGLELAPLARASVVFVTAHERYAVDAFAVEAFDYLLKPVDPDRLTRVLERLRETLPGELAPLAKVAVVAPGGTELLDFDQVYYVQADGDYSRVHTYDRSYLSTSSLGELVQKLGPGFARVHRSYVVNLAKVSGIRRAAPDRFRLQLDDAGRTELDVARRQSRELRTRLGL